MGSDQHFCLRWNNFHSNISASFEHLRDNEEFVDVTLACEGRSLKAHKVVLSACSPYFKNLLKQNPCQHPIIILRDVAFPDLSALLSFVYQGEVYVAQERLPTFLRTAEMLHIKGLTEQSQQQPHSGPSLPISIGPTSTTTILPSHEQGILNKAVSGLGSSITSGLCSTSPRSRTPPSPSLHIQRLPVHISPPPKKRRATTLITVPSGSPTTTTTAVLDPSTTSRCDVTQRSDTFGPSKIEGSTLAAALTKPLLPSNTTRAEREVSLTLSHLNSHQTIPPLLPARNCPSAPPLDSVPNVKQETEEIEEIKEEKPSISASEQAVNLVMEGSILRQRIQGFQSSPDGHVPPIGTGTNSRPPSQTLMVPLSHDESSLDDNFYVGGEGCGGEIGSDGADQEKDNLATSPMVIRSPLVGLLPRETTGLYGGAGTSGSLGHHDSSQDVVLNLSTGCTPKDTKKWPSRQPVNCQYCGVRISMAFNLRNHVKRCKMRPYNASGTSTGQSIRSPPLPCVPQTHQQPGQPEEASEDTAFSPGGSHLPPLQQTISQQVFPLDSHQLVPSRSEDPSASAPAAITLTLTPAGAIHHTAGPSFTTSAATPGAHSVAQSPPKDDPSSIPPSAHYPPCPSSIPSVTSTPPPPHWGGGQ